MRVGGTAERRGIGDSAQRRAGTQDRGGAGQRRGAERPARRPREPRGSRHGPQRVPTARPVDRPARPKTASQAKARAKARKAKAPKAIRLPLRERLLVRLAGVDLRPRAVLAKIPFVVLVIGSLAIGLGITLWLSTDAAQRSYQLSSARAINDALMQQKEALERDVLETQSAPALADAARNLGMIPSRNTAHLVQDPAGNWVVVGKPKPAEGVPPPPLNTKLPEAEPAPQRPPTAAPPPAAAPLAAASAEVPVLVPPPANPFSAHAVGGPVIPGPAPAGPVIPGPAPAGPVIPGPAPAGPVIPGPAPAAGADPPQGGLVLLPVPPQPLAPVAAGAGQ